MSGLAEAIGIVGFAGIAIAVVGLALLFVERPWPSLVVMLVGWAIFSASLVTNSIHKSSQCEDAGGVLIRTSCVKRDVVIDLDRGAK